MHIRSLSLGLLALLCACSEPPATAKAPPKGPPAVAVTLGQVAEREMEYRLSALAEVEAINSPTVSAEVAGKVRAIAVDVGQKVKAGQVLLQLDPQDLDNSHRAKASEASRLAALANNQGQVLKRYEQLKSDGFVSESYIADQRAQAHALQQQYQSAQAQAATAAHDLARSQVRAPQAGTIDARLVNVGEYVPVGKALFRLSSSGQQRVKMALSDRESARLRTGLTVRLHDDSGHQLETTLSEVRPAVDSQNRMLEMFANLPSSHPWRSGQAIQAEVVLERKTTRAVPQLAVIPRASGMVIYRTEKNIAHAETVKTGIESDGWVELLDGPAVGTAIAVDGAGFLTDGAKLRLPKPTKSAQPDGKASGAAS